MKKYILIPLSILFLVFSISFVSASIITKGWDFDLIEDNLSEVITTMVTINETVVELTLDEHPNSTTNQGYKWDMALCNEGGVDSLKYMEEDTGGGFNNSFEETVNYIDLSFEGMPLSWCSAQNNFGYALFSSGSKNQFPLKIRLILPDNATDFTIYSGSGSAISKGNKKVAKKEDLNLSGGELSITQYKEWTYLNEEKDKYGTTLIHMKYRNGVHMNISSNEPMLEVLPFNDSIEWEYLNTSNKEIVEVITSNKVISIHGDRLNQYICVDEDFTESGGKKGLLTTPTLKKYNNCIYYTPKKSTELNHTLNNVTLTQIDNVTIQMEVWGDYDPEVSTFSDSGIPRVNIGTTNDVWFNMSKIEASNLKGDTSYLVIANAAVFSTQAGTITKTRLLSGSDGIEIVQKQTRETETGVEGAMVTPYCIRYKTAATPLPLLFQASHFVGSGDSNYENTQLLVMDLSNFTEGIDYQEANITHEGNVQTTFRNRVSLNMTAADGEKDWFVCTYVVLDNEVINVNAEVELHSNGVSTMKQIQSAEDTRDEIGFVGMRIFEDIAEGHNFTIRSRSPTDGTAWDRFEERIFALSMDKFLKWNNSYANIGSDILANPTLVNNLTFTSDTNSQYIALTSSTFNNLAGANKRVNYTMKINGTKEPTNWGHADSLGYNTAGEERGYITISLLTFQGTRNISVEVEELGTMAINDSSIIVFSPFIKHEITRLINETGGIITFEHDTGTFNNTEFNGELDAIQLTAPSSNGTYLSLVMNLSSSKTFKNISWVQEVPLGKELGRAEGKDTSPPLFSGINTTGLVLLMHFNNESSFGENASGVNGDRVYDFSKDVNPERTGVHNNGTLIDDATINKTEFILGGGSLELDGVAANPDYVEIASTTTGPLSFGNHDFALSVWFKTSDQQALHRRIISMQESDGQPIIWIRLESDQQLSFRVRDTGGSIDERTTDSTYGDGKWHHVVGSWTDNLPLIFIDGVNVSFTEAQSTNILGNFISNDDWYIGFENDANEDGQPFAGNIDEVSIWNRSLNAEEVLNLYLRGAARLNISVRTCNDGLCDGETFTVFTNSTNSDISSLSDNQFIQYQANFYIENSTSDRSPKLNEVTIHYADGGDDVTDPIITNLINGTTTNQSSRMTGDISESANITNASLYNSSDYTGLVFSTKNSTFATSFDIFIGSLDNSTRYYFNITVSDAAANIDSDNFSFITASNFEEVVVTEDNNLSTNVTVFLDGLNQDISRKIGVPFNAHYLEINGTALFTRNGTTIANNSEQNLAVGFHNFTAFIPNNDTVNSSREERFATITQGDSSSLVHLNDADADLSVLFDTNPTVKVFPINYSSFTIELNGTSISNNSMQDLSVGNNYNITLLTVGGKNYTDSRATHFLNITRGTSNVTLTLNTESNDITVTYPQNINPIINVINSSGFTLTRNGTAATNNTEQDIAVGVYNYTGIVTQSQNYTSSRVVYFATITINTSSVNLEINGTDADVSFTGNQTINVTGTLLVGLGDITIERNGTVIHSGSSPLQNISNYTAPNVLNFTVIYGGNVNYTSSTETHILTLDPDGVIAASVLNLTLNGSDANLVLIGNQTINVSGFFQTGNGSITIFRNGTELGTGVDFIDDVATYLSPTFLNFTAIFNGTTNLTASRDTNFLTLTDPVPVIIDESQFNVRSRVNGLVFWVNNLGQVFSNFLSGSYGSGSAFVCVFDNGTVFSSDTACA